MAIGRTVVPATPTQGSSRESAEVDAAAPTWVGPARVVALRLLMVAFAAFAILVLLPVAVAAQAVITT